jgi:hypothetical protein
MNEATRQRTNAPALSIYLGPPDVAAKRLAALDEIANNLGKSRSEMIQMLADGRLILCAPPSKLASGTE